MKNDIQTPITESLVRQIITSYDKHRREYRLDAPIFMTADEIINQIMIDLKQEHDKNKR
jgi:tRNA uridine 5-carbamoylmethylation protein Kti12